jgi:hypothetical protein
LVGSQGIELEFHRTTCPFRGDDPDSYIAEFEENFGPMVTARAVLGDKFEALHKDLEALFGEVNQATDGSVHLEAEYLVAIGRKPA